MTMGSRVLNGIERIGNKLPDPVFLFLWLIGGLIVLSLVGAGLGWSAVNPVTGDTLAAKSLLAPENLERLIIGMPSTLTDFPPLGIVVTIIYGASVAERSGLFTTAIRAALLNAPKAILTPVIVITGMLSHHASDAAYVVVIPLAAVIFAAVGRHPLAGLAAGFAAVSGGYAGNLFPGAQDALLLGITEPAAHLIDPSYSVNIAGNWFFIVGVVLVFTPIVWFITDRIIEPRLGPWKPIDGAVATADEKTAITADEKRGLAFAGLTVLAMIALWALITALPGSPFVDPDAEAAQRFNPLYKSLAAFFALTFFMSGAAFGIGARSVTSHHDLVRMMREGIVQLAPYLVLVFFAAHFVAMFNWSGLGPILAINAAEQLRQINMPAPLLLISVVLVSCFFDLFVGSASAKWSALAPIVVPMFMLLGISPEMTTAAYRMGDSVTNIATPLMSYFPLILTFAQRWDPRFGLGSLMSTMLPYAGAFLVAGLTMVALWVALDLPLGPGVGVHYTPPPPAVAVQLPVDGGITGPVAPPEAAAVAGPGVTTR
ncbi:MAG: AbgT family transporter [Brevundimonas sp.]|uniref:AbgT family transporter n=1 Tax=Brevundimonas sp. TaxID=1871086 RepID=UPI00271CCD99|nr:AbgT family transporter [Brevundimonas sp.]MDO9079136.1 AbgT family transporter [Brevundimonas sp.]MDP3079448.1 AbgT family transporter [Brevundimonas sp.]MDZ4061803.1 AbgT family transporter [Brevundimonas sp.]